MPIQKEILEIIAEVANKYGLPIEEVEKMWKYQWKVTRKAISNAHEDEGFPTIRLPSWGVFKVTDAKKRKYLKLKEKRSNNDNS